MLFSEIRTGVRPAASHAFMYRANVPQKSGNRAMCRPQRLARYLQGFKVMLKSFSQLALLMINLRHRNQPSTANEGFDGHTPPMFPKVEATEGCTSPRRLLSS